MLLLHNVCQLNGNFTEWNKVFEFDTWFLTVLLLLARLSTLTDKISQTSYRCKQWPNALHLIVFTFYNFWYFVYGQIDFLVQNWIFTLLLISIIVCILNVHGLSETNFLRIRYSVLPFYTICTNRYTCQPSNKDLPFLHQMV